MYFNIYHMNNFRVERIRTGFILHKNNKGRKEQGYMHKRIKTSNDNNRLICML